MQPDPYRRGTEEPDMSSRSFSAERPQRPHLVTPGTGGIGGEVGDLRTDVEDAFTLLEADLGTRKPVRLATAAPLNACVAAGTGVGKTLTQSVAAAENIDSVAVVKGDRILVKNQVAGKNNGVYTVTTVGTGAVKQVLTRAVDFDSNDEVKASLLVAVELGTVNADTIWMLTTNNPIVLDTDALTFTQAGTAGVLALHAVDHITSGADEIDADKVDIDWNPSNSTPTVAAPHATVVDHLTAHLNGIDLELPEIAKSKGSVAVVTLTQSGQPIANETLAVGADTYEANGAGGNINFVIAGTAEGTLNNLLAAAVASGTEDLYWDKLSATQLRIRSASAPQGTIIASDPSVAITEGLTNWISGVGNVNMNTLAGKAAGKQSMCATKLTITSAMITAGAVRIAFPFPPAVLQITVLTSTGAVKTGYTDTFVVATNDVVVTLNGAGGDLANTNVLHIVAYE
jgi:hypothetical protein